MMTLGSRTSPRSRAPRARFSKSTNSASRSSSLATVCLQGDFLDVRGILYNPDGKPAPRQREHGLSRQFPPPSLQKSMCRGVGFMLEGVDEQRLELTASGHELGSDLAVLATSPDDGIGETGQHPGASDRRARWRGRLLDGWRLEPSPDRIDDLASGTLGLPCVHPPDVLERSDRGGRPARELHEGRILDDPTSWNVPASRRLPAPHRDLLEHRELP